MAAIEAPTTATVALDYADLDSIRVAAAQVRGETKYDGTLSPITLLALEPLLNAPIPERYIERTPAMSGKPYASTGVRSVQVQVDRMNAVLGAAHWRVLYRYEDGGKICQTTVIVGNRLGSATLDADGKLVPNNADVLIERTGWGGHARGSNRGDLYKGSETNALKRTLARIGPGSDVYRQDHDDDINLSNQPEYREPPRQAVPPPAAPEPEVDWDGKLAGLLAVEDALSERRKLAADGMEALGAPARQQFTEISKAGSEQGLDALVARINNALDKA